MNLIYFTFDPITMLIHVTLSSTGYVEMCVFIWLMHHMTFGLIHSVRGVHRIEYRIFELFELNYSNNFYFSLNLNSIKTYRIRFEFVFE
ncbi:hypothetical protein HanIR_Chr04g0207441 [Helianthus annuus]|nr:hypothetical protein HanIR_Chr04g0207441 [Helianthus annuus]